MIVELLLLTVGGLMVAAGAVSAAFALAMVASGLEAERRKDLTDGCLVAVFALALFASGVAILAPGVVR